MEFIGCAKVVGATLSEDFLVCTDLSTLQTVLKYKVHPITATLDVFGYTCSVTVNKSAYNF